MVIVKRDWKIFDIIEREIDISQYQEEYDLNLENIKELDKLIKSYKDSLELLPEQIKQTIENEMNEYEVQRLSFLERNQYLLECLSQ